MVIFRTLSFFMVLSFACCYASDSSHASEQRQKTKDFSISEQFARQIAFLATDVLQRRQVIFLALVGKSCTETTFKAVLSSAEYNRYLKELERFSATLRNNF